MCDTVYVRQCHLAVCASVSLTCMCVSVCVTVYVRQCHCVRVCVCHCGVWIELRKIQSNSNVYRYPYAKSLLYTWEHTHLFNVPIR